MFSVSIPFSDFSSSLLGIAAPLPWVRAACSRVTVLVEHQLLLVEHQSVHVEHQFLLVEHQSVLVGQTAILHTQAGAVFALPQADGAVTAQPSASHFPLLSPRRGKLPGTS